MSKEFYNWEFDSTKHRSPLWYTIVLSIIIGIIIWGFFSMQYGLSFLLILGTGLYYFIENNTENIIKVSIGELGINIVDSFYDYASINSYSIIFEKGNPVFLRLNMGRRSGGLKHLDLDINEKILLQIKNILPEFIEENPNEQLSFSEKLIKILKL